MRVLIRQEALELTFRMLLSCQCPLTDEQERALFNCLTALKPGTTLDCRELPTILNAHDNTPINRLVHFSVWMAPAHANEIVIERDYVLRHFSSSYHWNHVVSPTLSAAYAKVRSIPTWFLAHMLLPVALERTGNGAIHGIYHFKDGEIRLHNLFLPPELADLDPPVWGVHFASAITPLSFDEAMLVRMLGDANPLLTEFRGEISAIDYSNFERYGDYRAMCVERHAIYWSAASTRRGGTATG